MQKINLRELYPDVYNRCLCVRGRGSAGGNPGPVEGRCCLRAPEVPAQGPLLSKPGGWH